MKTKTKEISKSKLHQIDLKLWSLIARSRAEFVCAKCYQNNLMKGMSKQEAKMKATKRVDAHHIFEKGMNHSIMFDLGNVVCLCYAHHRNWIHSTSVAEGERIQFIKDTIGEDKYNQLLEKSKQIVKTDISFYIENFVRLYDIAMAENLRPDKIVPKYIVKELYEEVKDGQRNKV